jgi:hypothetical protein
VGILAWRLEDKALASTAQHETAEQLFIAVGSSALDGKREPEQRRQSSVAGKLFAAGGPSAISALNDKSSPRINT